MRPFPENITACPDCDLLQRIPALSGGGVAHCPRCGHTIASDKADFLNRTLALTIAAAIILIIANVTPLLGLTAAGRHASTTILGAVLKMWQQGQEITAVLVAFCTIVAPTVYVAFMLTVLIVVRKSPVPSWVGVLLRVSEFSHTWAMIEVMMLGILVALVKIATVATVIPGFGMFAVFMLIVLIASMTVNFDRRAVWSKIQWVGGKAAQSNESSEEANEKTIQTGKPVTITGIQMGLVSCETCGLLMRPPHVDEPGHCPRCGTGLELRRHNGIQRTWALLIAAAICYIPANLMPVMNTTMPGYAAKDTIMNGVILLYKTGSWPLALIVLIASVMIPLAKIIALSYLLITIQLRKMESREERIRLYRLVAIVGRWSMLDVFVVTFVVALVQLQPLMSVEPGAGVLFFAAVVVLTLLAAENFDPRLIWDSNAEKEYENDRP